MKILVIGSCTGSKNDHGCPKNKKLVEADFDDPVRLRAREAELTNWRKPAAAMYRGRQHTQMMDGVRHIRSTFGADACDVNILSAGYGVIPERQPIVPYNVSFTGRGTSYIKSRGEKLGVPDAIRKLIAGYPVVFLLLGDSYLLSAQPPLVPSSKQRVVAFGSPALRFAPGVTVIPTADEAAEQLGDNVRTRKGRLFLLLAAGLKQKPKMLDEIVRDGTTTTVLALMQAGKQYV